MSRPETLREALIVEALGDVAQLLDRAEELKVSMAEGVRALGNADAQLRERLVAFEEGMRSITEQVKAKTVEHVLRRVEEAAHRSIDDQVRAMREAARLAFGVQVERALERLSALIEQGARRMQQRQNAWLMHTATAAASCAFTWLMMTWWMLQR